jgi:outer membrane protein assembly factor BamE (lipoprotein component of BamABCDE complex)
MQFKLKPQSAPWLVAAGLVLGVAAANASNGFTVTHEQESLVRVGMTADAVQQTLGRPAHVATQRHVPGPTWAYDVAPNRGHAAFEIDFDGAEKVAYVGERELPVE